jgi:hypothetical protein
MMARRKRWLRQPLSWQRGGAVALVVLILVAGAALVLDAGGGGEYAPVVDQLEGSGLDPVGLVVATAREASIVLLSDVRDRAAPKRIAAEAIRRLAEGPGLDAVVLEVPASEQRYIEAYLAAEGNDASALMSRPAAVREGQGMPREYLRIYEAVREANAGLNPSRRIRVIAADVEGWPPDDAAPRRIGEAYSGRAAHMLDRMDRELFRIMPDARVLVFVDGYLTLQRSYGLMEFGGGEPIRVEWLGELLRQRSGPEARTVLVDAGAGSGSVARIPGYHGTALHRPLRRTLDGESAARVRNALAGVESPVLEVSTPGLRLRVLPEGYTLGEVARGYIFLPGGR